MITKRTAFAKTPRKRIKRLILKAKDGTFYGMSAEELRGVSKNDALRHPNWKMGIPSYAA